MRSRSSASVNPSAAPSLYPSSICWTNPATRTSKNSSRLLAEIDRNFNRSSNGLLGSFASSRTRRLKANHDNSRLRKYAGLSREGRTIAQLSSPLERACNLLWIITSHETSRREFQYKTGPGFAHVPAGHASKSELSTCL